MLECTHQRLHDNQTEVWFDNSKILGSPGLWEDPTMAWAQMRWGSGDLCRNHHSVRRARKWSKSPWIIGGILTWPWVKTYGTIFGWMNIHLPATLMFTRGTGFWPITTFSLLYLLRCLPWEILGILSRSDQTWQFFSEMIVIHQFYPVISGFQCRNHFSLDLWWRFYKDWCFSGGLKPTTGRGNSGLEGLCHDCCGLLMGRKWKFSDRAGKTLVGRVMLTWPWISAGMYIHAIYNHIYIYICKDMWYTHTHMGCYKDIH